jgi:hypothetical protein
MRVIRDTAGRADRRWAMRLLEASATLPTRVALAARPQVGGAS